MRTSTRSGTEGAPVSGHRLVSLPFRARFRDQGASSTLLPRWGAPRGARKALGSTHGREGSRWRPELPCPGSLPTHSSTQATAPRPEVPTPPCAERPPAPALTHRPHCQRPTTTSLPPLPPPAPSCSQGLRRDHPQRPEWETGSAELAASSGQALSPAQRRSGFWTLQITSSCCRGQAVRLEGTCFTSLSRSHPRAAADPGREGPLQTKVLGFFPSLLSLRNGRDALCVPQTFKQEVPTSRERGMGWEPDQPVWEFFMEHEVSNMKAAPKVGSPGAAMPPTFQA